MPVYVCCIATPGRIEALHFLHFVDLGVIMECLVVFDQQHLKLRSQN